MAMLENSDDTHNIMTTGSTQPGEHCLSFFCSSDLVQFLKQMQEKVLTLHK